MSKITDILNQNCKFTTQEVCDTDLIFLLQLILQLLNVVIRPTKEPLQFLITTGLQVRGQFIMAALKCTAARDELQYIMTS